MKFVGTVMVAGIVLLAPALLCSQVPMPNNAIGPCAAGFAMASIKPALSGNQRKVSADYVRMGRSLYEWCRNKAGIRTYALTHKYPYLADDPEALNNRTMVAVIKIVLLSHKNILGTIGALARKLPYGSLEVMRDIFALLVTSNVENSFAWHHFTDAEKETIINNCEDSKLENVRRYIRNEMRHAVSIPTKIFWRRRGAECTYADAIARMLRRRELYGADFYEELEFGFATLLKDESQRFLNSDFLAPLFILALKLQGFRGDHCVRCKQALLSSIMARDDFPALQLLEWSVFNSGDNRWIDGFVKSHVDGNMSPYFMRDYVVWCSRSMSIYNSADLQQPALDMLRSFFFNPGRDTLRDGRLRIMFKNRAFLNSLPPRFLYEIAEILYEASRDPYYGGKLRVFLGSRVLSYRNLKFVIRHARRTGKIGLLKYAPANAATRGG
ncbi:hypothetical protein PAPHI01_1395 [Pancytospora philotis]|nr:hypothetical protein PAPHI01_1395 [Pancytospora philotis]